MHMSAHAIYASKLQYYAKDIYVQIIKVTTVTAISGNFDFRF